jgi:hypothetical protein
MRNGQKFCFILPSPSPCHLNIIRCSPSIWFFKKETGSHIVIPIFYRTVRKARRCNAVMSKGRLLPTQVTFVCQASVTDTQPFCHYLHASSWNWMSTPTFARAVSHRAVCRLACGPFSLQTGKNTKHMLQFVGRNRVWFIWIQ